MVDKFPLLTFHTVHKTIQPSGCPWVKYFYPPVFIIFFFQKPYTVDSPCREILVSHSALHCCRVGTWCCLLPRLSAGWTFNIWMFLFYVCKNRLIERGDLLPFSLFVAKKKDVLAYRSSHLPCFSCASDLAQFHLPFNVPIPVLHLSPFSAFPPHPLEQLICNIKHMATFIEGKWVEKSNLLNDSSSGSSGTGYHGRWWWASEITPSRQKDRKREGNKREKFQVFRFKVGESTRLKVFFWPDVLCNHWLRRNQSWTNQWLFLTKII